MDTEVRASFEEQLHSLEENNYQLEHLYQELLEEAAMEAEVLRSSKNVSLSSAGQREPGRCWLLPTSPRRIMK